MKDVFISYSSKDRGFVEKLAHDLEKTSQNVFYDQLIIPGDSWVKSLTDAIESARFILLVMSPDYFASEWAQQEMQVGVLRETEKKAIVIPLMLRDCEPPPLLASKLWADFRTDYNAGLNSLVASLTARSKDEIDLSVPGRVSKEVAPDELEKLKRELHEAVELFKSIPEKPTTEKQLEEKRGRLHKKCFIVMPFGNDELEVVYEDFARPILEGECNLDCERGDDVFGSNIIMDDIVSSIQNADLIVADLTGKNANVFYEVGICHTLKKAVLLLAQSIDDVPFDLRHRRILLYDYSPRGCKRLEVALKENVLALLDQLDKKKMW